MMKLLNQHERKGSSDMYIVTNKTFIQKGEAHKLIERFNKVGKIEQMEGFLGLEVLETQKVKEHDEVCIVTRWTDEAAFKAWMKSDAFKQAHSKDGEGQRPAFIIGNEIIFQEVKVVRHPMTTAAM